MHRHAPRLTARPAVGSLRALPAWLALAALVTGGSGCGGSGAGVAVEPQGPPLVLLMPAANHTGSPEASGIMPPQLAAALAARGVRLLGEQELRPILRHHRIRSGAKFDEADAAALRRETGAALALFCGLDFYRPGPGPEAGLSARLVRLEDLQVLGAASVSATGEDAAGLFGLGRIEDAAVLAAALADRLAEELAPLALHPPSAATATAEPAGRGCRRVALVPLDDATPHEGAGEVATNILLSRLLGAGYLVLEPGLVRARCLASGVAPRGRIDLQTLRALHESLGPCLVITGSVEGFEPALGDLREAVPSLNLALRVLDAPGGRLLLTWETETDGAAGQGPLQVGRKHALGQLTWGALADFLDRLEKLDKAARAAGSAGGARPDPYAQREADRS